MKIKNVAFTAKRKSEIFHSEKCRVITKPLNIDSEEQKKHIIARVLSLPQDEVVKVLNQTLVEFSDRHRDLIKNLKKNYNSIKPYMPRNLSLTEERRLLLGMYNTCEYSVESAALFNPSIVLHPDQDNIEDGSARFIMSFRATGEGHISSIEFRSGIVDDDVDILFDPISAYVETPEIHTDRMINNHLFRLKIQEMEAGNEVTHYILSNLADEFTQDELENVIAKLGQETCFSEVIQNEAIETMRWLARSNYEIKFNFEHRVSERVIFPVSENESRGIEDARFVRFIDDDGTVTYYATYTAYNGLNVLPQLIETKDFITFKIITLNGEAVKNKGMALFPKRINGKFYMLSRQDGENNHIMCSDNIHFWQESRIIQEPCFPWEFVQIGNCGSPIETEAGWLVLTHGVGPMRKYSIGVLLLDLNDPSRIIGKLNEPILVASEEERDGYVPNVVYTCGAMIHAGELIMPYAIADSRCGIATLSVEQLLSRLCISRCREIAVRHKVLGFSKKQNQKNH